MKVSFEDVFFLYKLCNHAMKYGKDCPYELSKNEVTYGMYTQLERAGMIRRVEIPQRHATKTPLSYLPTERGLEMAKVGVPAFVSSTLALSADEENTQATCDAP